MKSVPTVFDTNGKERDARRLHSITWQRIRKKKGKEKNKTTTKKTGSGIFPKRKRKLKQRSIARVDHNVSATIFLKFVLSKRLSLVEVHACILFLRIIVKTLRDKGLSRAQGQTYSSWAQWRVRRFRNGVLVGWFSKTTGTSLDDGARSTNTRIWSN